MELSAVHFSNYTVSWQQSQEKAWFTCGFQMSPSEENNIFLKSQVVVELDSKLRFSVFKAEALNFYHRSHPFLLYPSHRYEWGSTEEEVGNRVIGRRQSVLFIFLTCSLVLRRGKGEEKVKQQPLSQDPLEKHRKQCTPHLPPLQKSLSKCSNSPWGCLTLISGRREGLFTKKVSGTLNVLDKAYNICVPTMLKCGHIMTVCLP